MTKNTSEELSEIQARLSRVPGYCNHETEGLNGVLGTGHALHAVGRISEDQLRAFLVVAEIIEQHQPASVGIKQPNVSYGDKTVADISDSLLTPAEAAELFGGAESSWRNRAASGEIPGAFKKGKQWLIPKTAVQ